MFDEIECAWFAVFYWADIENSQTPSSVGMLGVLRVVEVAVLAVLGDDLGYFGHHDRLRPCSR